MGMPISSTRAVVEMSRFADAWAARDTKALERYGEILPAYEKEVRKLRRTTVADLVYQDIGWIASLKQKTVKELTDEIDRRSSLYNRWINRSGWLGLSGGLGLIGTFLGWGPLSDVLFDTLGPSAINQISNVLLSASLGALGAGGLGILGFMIPKDRFSPFARRFACWKPFFAAQEQSAAPPPAAPPPPSRKVSLEAWSPAQPARVSS